MAPLPGHAVSRRDLRRAAFIALERVGDASLGEWELANPRAFHLRRRLSAAEAPEVGPVTDVRRTPEATRRALLLADRLRHVPPEVLAQEVDLRGLGVPDTE